MKNVIILACICAVACGPRADTGDGEEATALVMQRVPPGAPLDQVLHRLDEQLVLAMSEGMNDVGAEAFRRAEAITDRLLQTRMPFEWLSSGQYSLESRLRQIQSAADRILAQVRTNSPRDRMLEELRTLRSDVARLRESVAAGGTRAPPTIHELLSDTTLPGSPYAVAGDAAGADESAADTASQSTDGPLGTPVPPDTLDTLPR